MTSALIEDLKNSYINWLKQKITFRDLDGAVEITSPFIDRHNDYLQIYAVPRNGSLRLTDAGYIVTDLMMEGIDVSTKRRKEVFQTVLNGYGVQFSPTTKELFVDTNMEMFPQRKHMLLQAMLTINDMFMLSRPNVNSIFLDDVEKCLDNYEVRYTPNVTFNGKTGYSHRFDFVIPKSKLSSERVIRAVNNPTKQGTTNLIFSWTDTKGMRNSDSQLFVFLNDTDKRINDDIIGAYQQYDIRPIKWTEREHAKSDLSA